MSNQDKKIQILDFEKPIYAMQDKIDELKRTSSDTQINYDNGIKTLEEQTEMYKKELESATVEEILDKLYCTAYDEVTIVQSILASKKRTEIIMTHIKKIINFYIFDAESSKNDEKRRRAHILNDLYIKGKKQPRMSEMSKKYHISERQINRDKKTAIEEIAIFMFGIDGIRKM